MIESGANNLAKNKEIINKLNVFPVPDGDTGTNMNLSMTSGVKEMMNLSSESLQEYVNAFSKGLLMGARGNSGVILSQLFRGFSDQDLEKNEMSINDFVKSLNEGVEIAYQSVTNPVEGTILTVAKDMARVALKNVEQRDELISLFESVVEEAKRSLDQTPELLPILKEVGVVDSGGKGLVVIYEGFLSALKGKPVDRVEGNDFDEMIEKKHEQAVQSFISADSIEYGYCTEFFVELNEKKLVQSPFNTEQFRNQLSEYGDSLLVAADEQLVKVHIHTETPGDVLSLAQKYGDLVNIDIENMREQHKNIVEQKDVDAAVVEERGKYAIITVAQGQGLRNMLKSIGATDIIDGGQTMNPSTEDFLRIINRIDSEHIIVLPNNKNILLAANQAVGLTEKNVTVVPSVTIPQGIQALFEFDQELSIDENIDNMEEVMKEVKTGLVTYATRDTKINDVIVKKDDFIGLDDDSIKVAKKTRIEAIESLLTTLVDDDDEIATIFFGEDVAEEEINHVKQFVSGALPDIEVEFHVGNQPIYSYIVMVE